MPSDVFTLVYPSSAYWTYRERSIARPLLLSARVPRGLSVEVRLLLAHTRSCAGLKSHKLLQKNETITKSYTMASEVLHTLRTKGTPEQMLGNKIWYSELQKYSPP